MIGGGTVKYFLICDFSTISCDRVKVAEILSENEISFTNHNNFCWELDVPDSFGSPFCDTVSDSIYSLFLNYLNKNSFLLVVKADEYYPNGH